MLSSNSAFAALGPNQILDALDSAGWHTDGRINALNSYENRVYLIGLETGDSIVAKFYRPERWTDEAILEEHRFTDELLATDLPVVTPLQTDSGLSLHHWKSYRFAVYPRAGGRPPELDNPDQLETIGRTLGRLHLVGELHTFEHRGALDPAYLGTESIRFLLESNLLPADMHEVYRGVALDLMSIVQQRFDMSAAVTSLRIHGDFHPGNILWGSNDTAHLLDFDDTCTGPAVQDLWMFLSGDRQYASARLADLLEGYTQFREFNSGELVLIEALRALRLIHYSAWIGRRWSDPAFQQAFPFFAERRYWDEHVLALREQRAALDEPPLCWD